MLQRNALALAAGALAVLGTAAPAAGQVPIGGAVSDSTTGPLLAGTVYHTTSSLSIAPAATLTVQPGAVVKFGAGHQITVNGTLDVQGTAGSPAVFTSIADDSASAGGDTNGDGGLTTPAPGDWRGLVFGGGADASTLAWADVRYPGSSAFAGFELSGCDAAFTSCSVRDGADAGFELNNSSFPTVTGCTVDDCAGLAFDDVPLMAVPGFSQNAASGNAGGDVMEITGGAVTAPMTIAADNCLNGVLYAAVSMSVSTGVTLTLQEGVRFLMGSGLQLTVNGTLASAGTALDPVVFTSWRDDALAGDLLNDGPTAGLPGDWRGLVFGGASDASALAWTEVRYPGAGAFAGFELSGCDGTFTSCTVRDGSNAGFELNNNSFPTVAGCTVDDCAGLAFDNVALMAVPGFSQNAASGNAGGDVMEIASGAVTAPMTIAADNCLNGVLYAAVSMSVNTGVTLTLQEGVRFLMGSGLQLTVNGALAAAGTAPDPVVFTSWRDDALAGDLLNDGPTAGLPGDWRGLVFGGASDASALAWTEVRYPGAGAFAGFELSGCDGTFTSCTVRDGANVGFELSNNSFPTVTGCTITDCAGLAVDNAPISAVPGLALNTATGNGGGDWIETSGSLVADATIGPANCLGGALYLAGSVTVPGGLKLTLLEDAALKMGLGTQLTVNGTLDVQGTPLAPVRMTSLFDDAEAGDQNNDGALTTPSPGDWRGLVLGNSASPPSTVDGLTIRYCGSAGIAGLWALDADSTADRVEVYASLSDGFEVSALGGIGSRWIAHGCGGVGIDLLNGAFDLHHASAVQNAGIGIRAAPAWSGEVLNSIAWNNTGGNFSGFAAGEVRYSDGDPGFAGTDGNIDVDPLFEDEVGGDLDLQDVSPCIDAGDPFSAPDPDGTRADMGARYRDNCSPIVYCTGKTNSQSCAPQVASTGVPSVTDPSPFDITATMEINNKPGLLFYGYSPAALPFQGGTLCVLPPLRRTTVQFSNGNPPPDDCSGSYSYDFNARIQSGADPFLVVATSVFAQFWSRDPAIGDGTGVGLSNGIRFGICP